MCLYLQCYIYVSWKQLIFRGFGGNFQNKGSQQNETRILSNLGDKENPRDWLLGDKYI